MFSLTWPQGALSESLYVYDLVLTSKKIMKLRNKFLKWKEAFDSRGLMAGVCKLIMGKPR